MKIPGRLIAQAIEEKLHKDVAAVTKKGKTPHLVDILVGDSEEQLSFVAIKKRMATKLGIKFTLVHLHEPPSFQEFAMLLKKHAHNPEVTGIIIQQPLPSQLQTDSMYNYLPLEKEIEGHKDKSEFMPPLGLAILTALKYVYGKQEVGEDSLIKIKEDSSFFKRQLKNKRIVLVGRGLTGGQPIGQVLSRLRINYLNINSQTYNPADYYKEADIIITAAGKHVITPDMVKPGVVLLNVGLRKESEKLVGDYIEDDIKEISSFYTGTPGGLGPIDVLYLYSNLVDATKLQVGK